MNGFLLRNRIVAGALLLLVPFATHAQSERGEPRGAMESSPPDSVSADPSGNSSGGGSPAKAFLRDFVTDQKAIWTSPAHMSRNDWLFKALPLAAGTAVLIATDVQTSEALPNTPDQIRVAKNISQAGALYTLAAEVTIPIVFGKIANQSRPVMVGRSAALALTDSLAVNAAMKYTFLRERPEDGDGKGRFFHGGDSFPSGHAMLSWAVCAAMVRNKMAPRWVKIASCTTAAAVSLSRIAARQHFPGDVFMGAGLGMAIGAYSATHH